MKTKYSLILGSQTTLNFIYKVAYFQVKIMKKCSLILGSETMLILIYKVAYFQAKDNNELNNIQKY